MATITQSDKFDGNQIQVCVLAGGYVILRAIYRQQDLAVMTATASEIRRGGAAQPYPDQRALISAADRIFNEVGGDVSSRRDRLGRPYLQTVFPDAWTTLSNIANQIAAALGLRDVQIIKGDDFLSELWESLAQDPNDEDELVYLSDGTYVTKGGKLIEQ